MNATPPAELLKLGLCGPFVKKGAYEWACACPRCGGRDRFVIFTEREYPHWNYLCRGCKPDGGWIDELFPQLKQPRRIETPQERTERLTREAKEQAERLQAEIDRAQRVLKELQDGQSWVRYHEQLDESSRDLWCKRGIPDFFQDYWQLGYDPDRVVFSDNVEHHTPTLSIPIFAPQTWKCVNIRHRLLSPPKPNDKYRPERSGLPAALFVAEPDLKLSGKTLVVEGEIKSMVSFITVDDPNLQVVGLPGKTPSDELLSGLSNCDPLYICLDPDADGEELAGRLDRERCRVINLPEKIDDMILAYGLGKRWIRQVLYQSRRI